MANVTSVGVLAVIVLCPPVLSWQRALLTPALQPLPQAVPANNLPPSPRTEEIPARALTCPAHPAFLPLPHAVVRHPVSLHKPVQTGDWNRCYQVIPGAACMPPYAHGELVLAHILAQRLRQVCNFWQQAPLCTPERGNFCTVWPLTARHTP